MSDKKILEVNILGYSYRCTLENWMSLWLPWYELWTYLRLYVTKQKPVFLCVFQVSNIEDGFVTLMDDEGGLREDLKVPDGDVGTDLQNRWDRDEATMVCLCKL